MAEKAGGTARHALLDHVPEMVTISDRLGRILYANPATERVSGFAPEEFVSLDPFSRMHPEDRPRCEEAFSELLGNPGLSLALEHRVRHKVGSWRRVEGTFTSLFEDPDVAGLLATVRDVTASKEAEETLRESEEGQAFLLKLGDRMRAQPDDKAVGTIGVELLAEHLDLDRAYVATMYKAEDRMTVEPQYRRLDLEPIPAVLRPTDFPEGFREVEGHGLVVDYIASDTRLSDLDKQSLRAIDLTAFIVAPLSKGENHLVWELVAASAEPLSWTPGDAALLQQAAERIWAAVERPRRRSNARKRGEVPHALRDDGPGLLRPGAAARLGRSRRRPALPRAGSV
jgi:PAS domain S-box-containing protein